MTRKPNVLVFFTDQQRFDSVGLHGNPLGITPNFDRLARAGAHLNHSYSCQPVCGPARACLQTGMYATQVNVPTNGIALDPSHKTIADYFNDAGYWTGYLGKWHLRGRDDEFGPGPVPKELQGRYQYWMACNVLEFTSEAYHTTMYDGNGNPHDFPGYRVDALADLTIRTIWERRDASEPFFLFTSYIEPHFQNHQDDYPAPDGYRERFISNPWIPPDLMALGGSTHQHIAGYWGMIQRLDEALGRIVDALKSMKLLDDTIILFTSDHGCHFKTRNSEYKRSCHDSSIRVPTFFSGPGFNQGGQINQFVSTPDMTATLLDAAGISVPDTMAGRSIMPLLKRDYNDWPDDLFVQISESQCGRAVRTKRWKYGVNAPDADRKTPHSDRYVEEYLYDLECDPYELRNLVGLASHRPVADRMKDRLLKRMADVGEPTAIIENAPNLQSGQRRIDDGEADA